MAFPLLLRGLSPTSQWVDLDRAEVPRAEEAARPPSVLNPQDLLLVGEKEWGEFHLRKKCSFAIKKFLHLYKQLIYQPIDVSLRGMPGVSFVYIGYRFGNNRCIFPKKKKKEIFSYLNYQTTAALRPSAAWSPPTTSTHLGERGEQTGPC